MRQQGGDRTALENGCTYISETLEHAPESCVLPIVSSGRISLLGYHAAAAVRRGSAFALAIGLVMTASKAEARLEGAMRADFLRDNFGRCVRAAKDHPTAREILPSIISRICTCSSNRVADRLSPAHRASYEMGNRAERKQLYLKLTSYNNAALRHCMDQARRAGQSLGPYRPNKSAGSGI
jgi:hypothetical protein